MSNETALDLDAIENRAAAATEGPWFLELGGNGDGRLFVGNRADGRVYGLWEIVHASGDRLGDLKPEFRQQYIENAEFIAAARTDIPALVDEVKRLRGACHLAMSALTDTCKVLFEASGLDAEYESDADLIHETVLGLAAQRDAAIARAEAAEAEIGRLREREQEQMAGSRKAYATFRRVEAVAETLEQSGVDCGSCSQRLSHAARIRTALAGEDA